MNLLSGVSNISILIYWSIHLYIDTSKYKVFIHVLIHLHEWQIDFSLFDFTSRLFKPFCIFSVFHEPSFSGRGTVAIDQKDISMLRMCFSTLVNCIEWYYFVCCNGRGYFPGFFGVSLFRVISIYKSISRQHVCISISMFGNRMVSERRGSPLFTPWRLTNPKQWSLLDNCFSESFVFQK